MKKQDALESFHIYKETKAENQINDKLTAKENELFDTIIQQDPSKKHIVPQQQNTPKNSPVV